MKLQPFSSQSERRVHLPDLWPILLVALFGALSWGLANIAAASTRNGADKQMTQVASSPRTAAPTDVAVPPADAQKTDSGVAMKVLKVGRGVERPMDNDCVKVHFTLWRRDGALITSSRLRDNPEVQCLRPMTSGVVEALKGMVIGEERRVWVPAQLTFTYDADDPDETPVKVDLTFDIELLEIIKAPPAPTDLKIPSKEAVKTASGLAFQVLKKGTGTRHPSPISWVTLHLSGWAANGLLFESTVRGGHPALYLVSQLIPGLHEGVLKMVVGEKTRFWIPADLAYGDKPRRRGSPAGNLVYDVELLKLE